MSDLTVIYYTANANRQKFASKMMTKLRDSARGIPIISVSQKPIKLGFNVCVGQVGRSAYNLRRQIMIGAKLANTKYVAIVEDDSIYPKEHFIIKPTLRPDLFHYNRKVFMLGENTREFARKGSLFTGAIISSKDRMISVLEDMLKGVNEWVDDPNHNHPTRRIKCKTFRSYGHATFKTSCPIISIDHKDGMHPSMHHVRKKYDRLPFYGKAEDLLQRVGL